MNEIRCSLLYSAAKDLTGCLYQFPYQAPSDVPASVRADKELMKVISAVHPTTVGTGGKTQQTTISAAERMSYQSQFKSRIYPLLENCLTLDPEFAPAVLLYPKVAEYNTRAAHRPELIDLYERFLPAVEKVVVGTRGYKLIEKDIEGFCGNCFEKVERHLADFHYQLAALYLREDMEGMAKAEYGKAVKLCPKVYGPGPRTIKLI